MQEFVDLGEKIIFLVMLLASVLAIAVFIERFIVYKRNFNKESESLLDSLTLLIRHRDLKGTEKLLETHPMENSYTRFIHFVLEREKKTTRVCQNLWKENFKRTPEFGRTTPDLKHTWEQYSLHWITRNGPWCDQSVLWFGNSWKFWCRGGDAKYLNGTSCNGSWTCSGHSCGYGK